MYKSCINHEESTINSLRRDPAFAAEYLRSVIEDGDREEIATAIRRISEVYGDASLLTTAAALNIDSFCS